MNNWLKKTVFSPHRPVKTNSKQATRQHWWFHDKTRQDRTRQDKTGQDKTRQRWRVITRQDKTEQDKTRQRWRVMACRGLDTASTR
jgi:hypothetical protein